MTHKMEKKWVVISALLHAALLLGIGLSSRPAMRPPPVDLVVSLLSAPSMDLSGSDESSSTHGITSVPAPVKIEAKRKFNPGAQQVVAADPEPFEPSTEKRPPVADEPSKAVTENAQTAMDREPAAEPDVRITSPETTGDILFEESVKNTVPAVTSGYPGDLASHPRTANLEHQASLLAFAGDPSSLGGFAGEGSGPDFTRSRALSLPEPIYPVLCRKRGEEGRVVIEVKISAEGGVRGAKIRRSSSFPRLDRAALSAVEAAVFHPAMLSGVPVESEQTVAYTFRLVER